MPRRLLALTLFCLLTPLPAGIAAPPEVPIPVLPEIPIGPPPTIVFASAARNKNGKIELRLAVSRMVPEERVRLIEKDGRQVESKYVVHKPVTEQKSLSVDDDVKFHDREGKPIEPFQALKRLNKFTAVPIAFMGVPDSKYLEVYRDDVVVIVLHGAKVDEVIPLWQALSGDRRGIVGDP